MADIDTRFDAKLSLRARQFAEQAGTSIDQLQAERHAMGLSYSTVDEDDRVVHVHPDGTVRESRDPASPVIR